MAIKQVMCTSFKKALLDGEMDFSTNTAQVFKIALYTSSATLGAATTAYSTANEVTGTNYTAGGNTLTLVPATTAGTSAIASFADTVWNSATFTARAALVYQSGGSNPAVAVLDFGADYSTSGGNFNVQFPPVTESTAIIKMG